VWRLTASDKLPAKLYVGPEQQNQRRNYQSAETVTLAGILESVCGAFFSQTASCFKMPAKRAKDAAQTRRLLAIAVVPDGASRGRSQDRRHGDPVQ
jgi:hypothetical protein